MIMTSNQNYDAPWSDLNHDVLFVVMTQLGVIDFVSFTGVCKSWRYFALSNRNKFMASRPPMWMCISTDDYDDDKDCYCSLQDSGGRMCKTILPYVAADRRCVGVTCGYLVMYGRETEDFWLVNLITRHQLHFPSVPFSLKRHQFTLIRAILVFSPSSGWLLVITKRLSDQIWFSKAGKGEWNHVYSENFVLDLHAFKGRIYTLNIDYRTQDVIHICEMRLGQEHKLKLLETKNFPKIEGYPHLVSLDENLHLSQYIGESYKVHELDFGEMKWVYPEKIEGKYEFYKNHMNDMTFSIKQESWAGTEASRKGRLNDAYMWYFSHECLDVNIMEE